MIRAETSRRAQAIAELIARDPSFAGIFGHSTIKLIRFTTFLAQHGVTVEKTASWVGEADGYADGELVYDVWKCDGCGYTIDDGTDDPELLPNYCPNCGARMGGDGDA